MITNRNTFLKIVLLCLIFLFLGEIGIRGMFFLSKRDVSAFDPGYFLYKPDPFTGYALVPGAAINHPTLKTKIDSLGYRSREFAAKKPPGVYRIIVLGGSEAYGHGLNDGETWSDQLQSLFDRSHPGKVEVINAAVDGFSSFQALISFSTRLLDFSPDLILCYLGWNDIKYWPLVSPEKGFESTGLAERKDQPALWKQWFHKSYLYIVGRALRNKIPQEFVGLSKPATPSSPSNQKEDMDYGKYIFERNIRNIIGVAKVNDVKVCLINQLNLISDGIQDEEKGKIYYILKEDELVKAVGGVKSILERVAHEEKAEYVDLNSLITPNLEMLLDHVHVTRKGAAAIAQQIHHYLIKSGLISSQHAL